MDIAGIKTLTDAAQEVGIPRTTLNELIKEGFLKTKRIGQKNYCLVASIGPALQRSMREDVPLVVTEAHGELDDDGNPKITLPVTEPEKEEPPAF